jgi:hypothetical protein
MLQGNAYIDFEAWTTVWEEMGPKHANGLCYQNRSRALVREAHPDWGPAKVEISASQQWEAAATNWFVQTLKRCAEIRPKAKWGYYGLPSRGHSGGLADQPPWSGYAQKQLPIFEASSAIYPSIYHTQGTTTASNEQMVRSVLNMTKVMAYQVENITGQRPSILPFVWEFYAHSKHGPSMLNDDDLNISLALPKELGGGFLQERSSNNTASQLL